MFVLVCSKARSNIMVCIMVCKYYARARSSIMVCIMKRKRFEQISSRVRQSFSVFDFGDGHCCADVFLKPDQASCLHADCRTSLSM